MKVPFLIIISCWLPSTEVEFPLRLKGAFDNHLKPYTGAPIGQPWYLLILVTMVLSIRNTSCDAGMDSGVSGQQTLYHITR